MSPQEIQGVVAEIAAYIESAKASWSGRKIFNIYRLVSISEELYEVHMQGDITLHFQRREGKLGLVDFVEIYDGYGGGKVKQYRC